MALSKPESGSFTEENIFLGLFFGTKPPFSVRNAI